MIDSFFKPFSGTFHSLARAKLNLLPEYVAAESAYTRKYRPLSNGNKKTAAVKLTDEQRNMLDCFLKENVNFVRNTLRRLHVDVNSDLFEELADAETVVLCRAAATFDPNYTRDGKPVPFGAYARAAILCDAKNMLTRHNLTKTVSIDSDGVQQESCSGHGDLHNYLHSSVLPDTDLVISVCQEFENVLSGLSSTEMKYVEQFILSRYYLIPYQIVAAAYNMNPNTARTNINRGAVILRTPVFSELLADIGSTCTGVS